MPAADSTFTYQGPGDSGLFADPLSEVRFLARDTEPGAVASLTDQEVAYFLAGAGGNVPEAAARAAEARAGRYAATPKQTLTIGPFSTTRDFAQNAMDMRAIAVALRSGETSGASPLVGLADEWAAYQAPVFDLNMTDFRGRHPRLDSC